MDPRDRAELALARARARGANVVTPDDAVSPMDATNTVQIPRVVVDSADATMVISHRAIAQGDRPAAAAARRPERAEPVPQWPGGEPVSERPDQTAARTHRDPGDDPPARHWDGLVPTVQQPGVQRSALARRLEGGE